MHDVTDKIDYVGIAKRLLKCLSSKNTAKKRESFAMMMKSLLM